MNRRGRCDLQLASRCQESSVPHVEAPLALSGKPTHTVGASARPLCRQADHIQIEHGHDPGDCRPMTAVTNLISNTILSASLTVQSSP